MFIIPSPGEASERVALVIGNGTYAHLAHLDNPPNDARLMASTLEALGFSLIGGKAQIDLDKAGFEQAIREFGARLAAGSVGLFYYAGHGVQVKGANYLIPIKANPMNEMDVDFELIDAGLVLRVMEAAGSKLNFVILDACRNNPFGGRGLRDIGGGLAQMKVPSGTLISYATQPGNVAEDGSNGDSPYTLALAAALKKPGVRVLDVFNDVGLDVGKATGGRQQPWVSASPLQGDFYFAAPTNAVATSAAPVTPAPASTELVFWQTISGSTSSADFKEYLRQYPTGQFAGLARNRLASLEPPPAVPPGQKSDDTPTAATPSPIVDPRIAASELQTELQRVGCYIGPIDGDWGPGSASALRRFNDKTGGSLDTRSASVTAIDTVKAHSERVCPAVNTPATVTRQYTGPASSPRPRAQTRGNNCFIFNHQQVCD